MILKDGVLHLKDKKELDRLLKPSVQKMYEDEIGQSALAKLNSLEKKITVLSAKYKRDHELLLNSIGEIVNLRQQLRDLEKCQ